MADNSRRTRAAVEAHDQFLLRLGRVLRDGAWNDDPQNLCSAFRNGVTTDNRYYLLGFRLARTLAR